MNATQEKQLAARAAAGLVQPGMRVGLGTGSTVAFLLAELAARDVKAVYVATSPETEHAAHSLGMAIQSFSDLVELDIAIDGADQVCASGWLIKGGGGAHTREKIVAACASRFVVIADASKLVASLHKPVPLELLSFGLAATLGHLPTTVLRDVSPSPDGGRIADYYGDVSDPASLCRLFSSTPGIVEHGLFPPALVSEVLVGRGDKIERLTFGGDE